MTELRVWRAGLKDAEEAYRLVEEYNESVGVVLRDSPESFAREYFGQGAGLWLASVRGELAGCIGLRPLREREQAGEIKRMYVRPGHRGSGVAMALLVALEQFAEASGYHWLYLDSKDDLKAALRFYDRHGYQACDRYNRNPQATVFLRKPLHQHASAIRYAG